jgi:nicotinate-nucleotide adenylyltransferase
MGGTFDPIHCGHVLLAQFACEALALDQVLFIPAAAPPHKDSNGLGADAEDRWHMAKLAVAGMGGFEASRLELERPGKSYTVDTLRSLRQSCPDYGLYLLIGADNVPLMDTWYDPEGIFSLCTVVAGTRSGVAPGGDPELMRQVERIETPRFEFSSTQIRDRCRRGLSIRYMVPEQVEAYIREKGLYRN